MATRDDIVTRVYQLLGDPSDVEEFDEDTVVIPKVEDVVSRICKGIYINPVTAQIYRGGYLPFLDASTFYTSVQPIALQDDVATTDVVITFDTTNFLDTGGDYIYINWDIIKYTGKTATTITGVTWIWTTHKAGDLVYQLYKLPTSITKPFTLFRMTGNQNNQKVTHVDFRQPILENNYYTILRDWTQDLLNIVGFWGDLTFMMIYIDKNATMATGATECIIPDCTEMVAHLVAWELLYEYEEYEDWPTKLQHWCALLNEMYMFYAKQTKDTDRRTASGNPVTYSKAFGWVNRWWRFRII